MKTTTLLLLVTFASLGISGAARAQSAGTEVHDDGWVPVKHLEFSDEDVEGGLHGPEGELIVATERAHQPSLIEIREGFEAELIKTMENQ
jgi:hypothetical protein